MQKFELKRPPKVRLFKLERDISNTIHRNLSKSRIYYVLLYNQGETLLGTYQDGRFVLPEGKAFNEKLMNEIRVFDSSCEMRIIKNETKVYVGRQIIDENASRLSDTIKRVTDSDYLYDELYELAGETNKRFFNMVSSSRKGIHKGLVGGSVVVPLPEIRWLGIRNYIESLDDSGLKFTDSRLVTLLDDKRQIVDTQKLMTAIDPSL